MREVVVQMGIADSPRAVVTGAVGAHAEPTTAWTSVRTRKIPTIACMKIAQGTCTALSKNTKLWPRKARGFVASKHVRAMFLKL